MKKYLLYFYRIPVLFILLFSFKAWGQGSETFEAQSKLTASYTDGSFSGETAGVTVNFIDSRNEGTYAIDGKGIMFRGADAPSSVEIVIPNGVGTFSFKYRKAFTGATPRTLAVQIDGFEAAITPVFGATSGADATVHDFTLTINRLGDVRVKITYPLGTANGGRQVTIDDVTWTGFAGTPEPKINLQGNGITIPNGDLTTSVSDGTDFGTNIIAGTDVEKTFTIQNQGSGNLILNAAPFVQLAGANGFAVSMQPAAASMAGFFSQNFRIKFNSTVPGIHTETVRIESSDPLTPIYSFNITAAVLSPSITSDKSVMTGFTYAFGQGPSGRQPFLVNGNNLAGDITVTASVNWEISTNLTYDGANVSPWNSIVLSKTAANTVNNRQIYVRLKDGLPAGDYTGTVTLASLSAPSVVINLTGSVTAGIAFIKVTGNGTAVANGSASPNGLNNTLFASQNLGNSQTKPFVITNSGGAPLIINTLSISAGDASSFTILNPPLTGTVLNTNETAGFDVKFSPNSVGTKNATVSIVNSDPDDNPYTFAVQGGATFCSSPGDLVIAKQDFETAPGVPVLAYTLLNIGTPGPNTGFSSGNSGNNAAPKNNNLYSEGARGYRIQGGDPGSVLTSGVQFNFEAVDTSAYTDLKLTLKVAGYSIGSTTNGMDCNGAAGGDVCVPNDQKSDFVLVEISPDGGVTWYPQAKAVAGEMNVAWSFGSKGTALGSGNYTTDNNLTYFNSTSALQYSAIVINNLPSVPQLKVRITAQDNALNESWILDDIRITSTGIVPKVWNGVAWLPSAPTNTDRAVIDGDYITADHGVFKVCQCEVKNGRKLTVSENTAITVTDALKNDGHILVESNGGLVQLNDANTNSGAGSFTAERKIKLSVPAAPLTDRSQYNYLISPVAGFNLKTGIYNGIPASYVLYYNESNNYFYESSGAYIPGRALAVKEPGFASVPVSVNEVKAVFRGVPVNGTSADGSALVYTAVNSNPGVESPPGSLRGYHLIGNPYPSNMDLVTFYNQNGGQAAGISSSFYFWDNTANNTYVQYGSGYSGNAYAQYNAVSLTPTKATGESGLVTSKIPTRYVAMGQGFMTRVLVPAKTLTFSNSIRKPDAATAFFGKNTTEMDRFWLNMITPSNIASNIAVVYFEDGNSAYAADDSPLMGGSDALYSIAGEAKVSINGRSSFVSTDVVKLGTRHFAADHYTLAVDQTEGIFSRGQQIYLADRKTGIVTNLSEGNYTFAAESGEDSNRFEVLYEPETTLVTGGRPKDHLTVYQKGNEVVLNSGDQKINGVEVFDAAGRSVDRIKTNAAKVSVNSSRWNDGVYLLYITRGSSVTVRKVMK
ncbi:hypothetical protein CBW16_08325 [Flavobacteriaceae bacterium JJC]|nr:hypothetical protein CBW16_08325 [Flavobacteriaceae bacterium JJC]